MNTSRTRQEAELRGRRAEIAAALMLRAKGYRILNTRYKTPVGEIDIVASRGKQIVFAEVKWRKTRNIALESGHAKARVRIGRAAGYWLGSQPRFADFNTRFDVIALAPWRWPVHLKQAFDLSDHI